MKEDRIEKLRKELQEEIDAIKRKISIRENDDKHAKCYPGMNEVIIGASLLLGIFSVQSFIINVNEPMEIVLTEVHDQETQNQTNIEVI